MNKILANTVFAILLVVVVVVLGGLMFLSNYDIAIKNMETELNTKEIEFENCKKTLDNIKEPDEKQNKRNPLLQPGQEGQLMKLFLNKNIEKYFKINSYDLYASYFYKPESLINEMESSSSPLTLPPSEELPQLDENGMPINAHTEADDEEWQGIETVPVKITFTARAEGMNQTLSYFKNMPLNAMRAADFILEGKIIKGTLIFAFPLNGSKD